MSNNITKADLAKSIADKNPAFINAQEAKEFIDAAIAEINADLAAGNDVKLSGLGTFHLRRKPSRPGRNPRTKVGVTITARTVVNFHASALLRQQIDHSAEAASNDKRR